MFASFRKVIAVRPLALILCISLLALTPPAFAKTPCATPAEVATVQLRQMQVEMMVSTMRCDSSTYDFRQHYAAFMERLNPLLTDNAKRLRTLVRRQRKGDIDRFITAMSNDAQNISQQDPEFCTHAVDILDRVAGLSAKDIPAFASQTIPSPFQMTTCPAPKKTGTNHG